MSTVLIVLAAIAIGTIVAYAVALTMNWLRQKITNLIAVKRAKKVVVSDIHNLVKECNNKVNYKDLENLCNKGITDVIVPLDSSDQVIGNVEFVKDINSSLDKDVEEFLGREKMVVVEA